MPDAWDFTSPRRLQSAGPQAPILTYLLVALSVVITGAAMLSGGQPSSLLYSIGNFGYAGPEAIWNGHFWGLVTTVFIHGGVFHLLFNMIWLVQLGRILERSLSPVVYPLFLAGAAAAGSACEMLISGTTGIGMSGVVYAMFGLMWGGRGSDASWRAVATRENLRFFIGWGLFCVVATQFHIAGFNVANGAHGGGFLFGLCIGFLFFSPRRRYIWAVPLALLLTASVLACTWQPWSRDWTFWKGNQEFDHQNYSQAIRQYQASLARGGHVHDNWYNISLAWNHIAAQAQARKDMTAAAKAQSEADSAERNAGPSEDTQ